MTDFLKRPISIGDAVVYLSHSRSSSYLCKDVVIGLSPSMVLLKFTKKSPDKLIVVNDQLAANLATFPEAYL